MKAIQLKIVSFLFVFSALQAGVPVEQQIRRQVMDLYIQTFKVPASAMELSFLRIPSVRSSKQATIQTEVLVQSGQVKLGYRTFIVHFSQSGRLIKKAPVSVEAAIEYPVLVAKQKIKRHQVIGQQAVELKTQRIVRDWDLVCRNETEVQGQEASRVIRKGALILKNMFRPVPLIHNGDEVKLQIRTGNLTVESLAVAKEDGGRGDIISLESKINKKRLTGRIEGPGLVVIPQEGQL